MRTSIKQPWGPTSLPRPSASPTSSQSHLSSLQFSPPRLVPLQSEVMDFLPSCKSEGGKKNTRDPYNSGFKVSHAQESEVRSLGHEPFSSGVTPTLRSETMHSREYRKSSQDRYFKSNSPGLIRTRFPLCLQLQPVQQPLFGWAKTSQVSNSSEV